ncbi:CAP domain-containing protein [Actinokineospora cianjurensis]|uniref:CAP domain-containing protein n=1 Tax=Actinokineospora cianjurensis TaxID=585224 RepID=UPI001FE3A61F|nr:CAP domain-containing protein [Actinokineospora cianjurensis]
MTRGHRSGGRRTRLVPAVLVALAVGAGTAGVATLATAPSVGDGTLASPDEASLDRQIALVEGTTADPSAESTTTTPTTLSSVSTTPTTTTTTSSSAPVTTTTTTTVKPTTTPPKPTTTQPPPPVDPSAAGQVLAITNDERAKAGCAPLVLDARLNQAAQAHSADMSAQNYFSHTSLDGRTFVDRAKAAGYPSPGAENIAKGQRTAAQVMTAWMNSSGHRANILNCGLTTMGLGFVQNGYYWTQIFGR